MDKRRIWFFVVFLELGMIVAIAAGLSPAAVLPSGGEDYVSQPPMNDAEKNPEHCDPERNIMDRLQYIEVETGEKYMYTLSDNLEFRVSCGVNNRKIPMFYVRTNRDGIRDDHDGLRDNPSENLETMTRILVIGDSFTFGSGVNKSDRYTERLEERLTGQEGGRYEVINAGVPAWGMREYYLFLTEQGIQYNPDIVVVTMAMEDVVSRVDSRRFDRLAEQEIPEDAENYEEMHHQIRHQIKQDYVTNLDIDTSDIPYYMERILETTSADTQTIFYAYLPFSEDRRAFLRSWAADHNTTFIPAPPSSQLDFSSEYTISPVDPHYNARGHEILAKTLYEGMMREGVLNSAG